MPEPKSNRNRTLSLTDADRERLAPRVLRPDGPIVTPERGAVTVHSALEDALPLIPPAWADLVFIDPPYNLTKDFHGNGFRAMSDGDYAAWVESWLPGVLSKAKGDASAYFCADWRTSAAVYPVLARHAIVRNRITWQREKGRGSERNWKNSMEDIWFLTLSDRYYFDSTAVMQEREVIAPYREAGVPKDWIETPDGKRRMTKASNFWDDITVPFWSMGENTDHPTQKPEKLVAKILLASCPPGGIAFDPFLGSGTTSAVALKLGRKCLGVEANPEYCLWAEARMERAARDSRIQGFEDGVFRARNSPGSRKRGSPPVV